MTKKGFPYDTCMNCCHYHLTDNHRCIRYHDSLCEYVYRFCNGLYYADKNRFASVDMEISKLQDLRRITRVIQKNLRE